MADEIPASPAPALLPTPVPAPAPASTTTTTAALAPKPRYTGLAVTSWILIVLTALFSVVPVIGFASWVFAFIVIPIALVCAIIILTRGGTAQGIFLILVSIVILPIFLFCAPVVSTILLGAGVTAHEQTQEREIITNLNKIDSAKSQWASQNNVSQGTAPTMADLSKYLDGGQIKPVVGETYEPRAIGESAAAKLPPNKGLASHNAGEEITTGTAAASSPPAAADSPSPSPSPSASAEEE